MWGTSSATGSLSCTNPVGTRRGVLNSVSDVLKCRVGVVVWVMSPGGELIVGGCVQGEDEVGGDDTGSRPIMVSNGAHNDCSNGYGIVIS